MAGDLFAHDSASPLMESSMEVINGIPQTVYKIPMDATASNDLADIDLARMFDRIIIGPTPYPWVIAEALGAALRDAGVEEPHKRIVPSNIPIR